jgi:twitching motility two-component system response regulator PilH
MMPESNNQNAFHRPSILIVEDSPPQALKVKLILESNGCDVVWVDTGWAGVEMAKSKHFDLIVLDVELPDINGFTVCQKLKAQPTLTHVPVVMMTTRDQAEDVLNPPESAQLPAVRRC